MPNKKTTGGVAKRGVPPKKDVAATSGGDGTTKVETSGKIKINEHGAPREEGVAGSRGSKFPARYDLISTIGLRRVAETCGEGALKYGQNSYLKGMPETDLLNHALSHINMHRAGDTSEDHIAHATWNLLTLMHMQETRPDCMDLHLNCPEGAHP